MLEGRQPTLFGDGEQTRDFVYVEDVVEANICAISQGEGSAFNIGTNQGVSINNVVALLQEITGYRWPPEHSPARSGDVYQIYLDNTKAAEGLGWSPQATLRKACCGRRSSSSKRPKQPASQWRSRYPETGEAPKFLRIGDRWKLNTT